MPLGSPHTSNESNFQRVEEMQFLGHLMAAVGTTILNWLLAPVAMWRAFAELLVAVSAQELARMTESLRQTARAAAKRLPGRAFRATVAPGKSSHGRSRRRENATSSLSHWHSEQ